MSITLKAARINKNLNQKEAARELGISVDTLGKYERGISFPNVPTIQKMEKLYGVSYNDLIFLPENYGLTVIGDKEEKQHE